jgi:hypothetical protein
MVSPLALIFFGKQVSWGHGDTKLGGELINVDSLVKFNCATGTGDLVSAWSHLSQNLLQDARTVSSY